MNMINRTNLPLIALIALLAVNAMPLQANNSFSQWAISTLLKTPEPIKIGGAVAAGAIGANCARTFVNYVGNENLTAGHNVRKNIDHGVAWKESALFATGIAGVCCLRQLKFGDVINPSAAFAVGMGALLAPWFEEKRIGLRSLDSAALNEEFSNMYSKTEGPQSEIQKSPLDDGTKKALIRMHYLSRAALLGAGAGFVGYTAYKVIQPLINQ